MMVKWVLCRASLRCPWWTCGRPRADCATAFARRLTGWVLSVLPLVLGILLYMVNPETMSVLWTRKIGIELLYGAGIMTVIGGLIIRKIVNMEV